MGALCEATPPAGTTVCMRSERTTAELECFKGSSSTLNLKPQYLYSSSLHFLFHYPYIIPHYLIILEHIELAKQRQKVTGDSFFNVTCRWLRNNTEIWREWAAISCSGRFCRGFFLLIRNNCFQVGSNYLY